MKGKEEEMDYTPVETISLAPNIILESIRDPHRTHCNDVWLVGRGKRLFVETIHGAIKRKTIILAKSRSGNYPPRCGSVYSTISIVLPLTPQ